MSRSITIGVMLLAASASRLTWMAKTSLPIDVGGGYVARVQGRVVYAGGTNWRDGVKHWLRDVNRYDPAADRWEPGPVLPVPLAYGSVIESGGAMEILGGTDGTKVFRESWRLASGAAEWKLSGMLPAEPLLGRAVEIDGRVYQFGGCPDVVDLTGCSARVWAREGDGHWREVSGMPWGNVSNFAAAAVGQRVFLFGGCAMPAPGKLENRADAYSFDVRAGTWKRLHPLTSPNRGLPALALDERRVMICGGYTDTGFSAEVAIYDLEKDAYQVTAPLPLAVSGMEFVLSDKAVLGFGGEDRMRGRTARVLAGSFQ